VKPLLKDVNSLRSALLIGGESMGKQMAQLRGRPRLIVGTPGRIHDHLRRGTLALDQASFLVLDETDRMLDMGFGKDLQAIVGVMQSPRQTLLFSATLSKTIEKVAQAYLVKPERIAIGSSMKPALTVDQDSAFMQEHEKYDHLLGELERRDGSVIVFVNTKRGAEHLADKLKSANHRVGALHGDLRQNHRDRVIQSFRRQDYTVMVATDVAARGLDIPHIAHVINYDLPQCAEDYIHRIGRTGRAGTTGSALCMVSPNDNGKWRAIQKLMDPNANNSDPEPFPRSARSRSGGGGYGGGQRRSGGGGGGGGYGQRREGASPQGFRSFGGGRRRSSGR
jgi:superfamily II DNA/RNA helicase